MKDYVKGNRVYPLIVRTSQLDRFSEKDFEDVATCLSSIDLSSDEMFNIRPTFGDSKKGNKVYNSDCKTCHAKDGDGRPRKEPPPLAGQHPEYLYAAMRGFKEGNRIHANDNEDDTFEDYGDSELINVAAYLATLDDDKIVAGYMFQPPLYRPTMAAESAMIAKAEEIGLKKVAQQKVSMFLSKQGVKMPHLSIFQFCNPMDARLMVIADPVFSSYMPCRISMVEDGDGKLWLMMLNPDMLISSKLMPGQAADAGCDDRRRCRQALSRPCNVGGSSFPALPEADPQHRVAVFFGLIPAVQETRGQGETINTGAGSAATIGPVR